MKHNEDKLTQPTLRLPGFLGLLLLVLFSFNSAEATDHTGEETHLFTNALIDEKSPYLLQHAHNPVDWYPWGEQAFEKARKENKLIFLSIGYSTCHWCHVMEHETFEDKSVADLLAKDFISIKVDREERPDIDNLYMGLAQAIGAGGGWPLNLFLNPEKIPFAGGTYFPPQDMQGRPSFKSIVTSIAQLWRSNSEQINEFSAKVKSQLINNQSTTPTDFDGKAILSRAVIDKQNQYEEDFGGFSNAPKFPMPHALSFLLRDYYNTGSQTSLDMVTHTLDKMAEGGIYDQIGGGFHRYSVDREWLAPHFEKMLYDQALLIKAYLEAFQITKKARYAEIVREIIVYLKRDMLDQNGGFYSAEDADSEGEEGLFYIWSLPQVHEVIGDEHLALIADWYELSEEGNFEEQNILTRKQLIKPFAKAHQLSVSELESILGKVNTKLLQHRSKRIRPHLDDKIMTDWNGLLISALSLAAQILPEDSNSAISRDECARLAQNAADFIMQNLTSKDGRLIKSYRKGPTKHLGFIEDYAFYTNGLIDLYETTFELKYLREAIRLGKDMKKYFWDTAQGGFFFVANDQEALLQNPKEIYDGAIPSGNSMAAMVLARLANLTGDKFFSDTLDALFRSFSQPLSRHPSSSPQMLQAVDFTVNPSQEIVIATKARDSKLDKFLDVVYESYLPRKVLVLNLGDTDQKELHSLIPYIQYQGRNNDKMTFYLCENFACKQPTSKVKMASKLIKKLATPGLTASDLK